MAKFLKSLRRKLAGSLDPDSSKPSESLPRGFLPMGTSYKDNDVFIIGFPKSGHTWCQNLVGEALYGFTTEPTPGPLLQDLVPDIHYRTCYKRYRSPMFFKAHALPAPEFRKVVYLLRDGRDAMVSYWHFLKAMEHKEIDFLHLVNTGEGVFPCKWHDHIRQWRSNPHNAQILEVRYEDLKSDTVGQLGRILDFAGIARDKTQIERAVQRSSFESMQKREKERGMEHPQWQRDKLFVRRGQTGSYKDEMPENVQAAFMAEAGALMRELGYAP